MGTGSYFADVDNPRVIVNVGLKGDPGFIEISSMFFTVQGATAGAVLMEWNVHQSTQAVIYIADSMLMYVTSESSGYFDNVWAWVADHDLDDPRNADATESTEGTPLNVYTQISVHVGRGILVEWQGPTWFYGTSSEHSQMYQYQLLNAASVYLGYMQMETPYYQPNPNALGPYRAGSFPSDLILEECADEFCKGAWAFRVLNSSDAFVHSARFYFFFQDNQLGCTGTEDCKLSIIKTNYATGNVQIVSPRGGLPPLLCNSSIKNGYTSEISAWLALSTAGKGIGNRGNSSVYVTIDSDIWSKPPGSVSIAYNPPCIYILPSLTLSTKTTFVYPPLTTSLDLAGSRQPDTRTSTKQPQQKHT
ncbi:Glucan 1,3-beta-glucosidase [Tolypocladium paradoxum]|uniref:Glucan 1,3-beta-glucosidase n=1 Tax=Tolypocladium paradoxum TaxID=94208 RepID=A0A2S4KLQ4_9HYPO|nr:Glucan 1,3-beta-glucosidase [Tolypocladium paradoxum]